LLDKQFGVCHGCRVPATAINQWPQKSGHATCNLTPTAGQQKGIKND